MKMCREGDVVGLEKFFGELFCKRPDVQNELFVGHHFDGLMEACKYGHLNIMKMVRKYRKQFTPCKIA